MDIYGFICFCLFYDDPGKIFREIVGNENLSFKFLGKIQVKSSILLCYGKLKCI